MLHVCESYSFLCAQHFQLHDVKINKPQGYDLDLEELRQSSDPSFQIRL